MLYWNNRAAIYTGKPGTFVKLVTFDPDARERMEKLSVSTWSHGNERNGWYGILHGHRRGDGWECTCVLDIVVYCGFLLLYCILIDETIGKLQTGRSHIPVPILHKSLLFSSSPEGCREKQNMQECEKVATAVGKVVGASRLRRHCRWTPAQ